MRRTVALLAALCCQQLGAQVTAGQVDTGQGQCGGLKVTVGPFNVATTDVRVVALGIPAADFTRAGLRCLVEHIESTYGAAKSLTVLVFDNASAATHYSGPTQERGPEQQKILSHLHASYLRDAQQIELTLQPIGTDRETRLTSQIDLQTNQRSDCRVAVADRCLMAMDELVRDGLDGSQAQDPVTLSAALDAAGRLRRIRYDHAGASSSAQRLANRLAGNLKTWRFESRSHASSVPVRITLGVSAAIPATATDIRVEDAGSPTDIRVTIGAWAGGR